MIEEITALMPLLDKISDGALWAFLIYMAVVLCTSFVWPVTIGLVLVSATKHFLRAMTSDCVKEVDIRRMRLTNGKSLYVHSTDKDFEDLFLTIAGGSAIHTSDIRSAMEKINA
jgi:hypothetical protein